MFQKLIFCLLIMLAGISISAQDLNKIQGFVERGGKVVRTAPTVSHTVQESYPTSTVTVYNTGTLTLASIFSDVTGLVVKANPFTADSNGFYWFFVANGCYDVKHSGLGILTPFTISRICVSSGAGVGSVTSVGLSAPAQFSVSGSPVTTTGTLGLSWVSQSASLVLASPCGGAGIPGFRALCDADLGGTTALGYNRVQEEGANLTQRRTINFIGTGMTCVDDAGNTRTDCTIATGLTQAYDRIQDEAANLTQRSTVNFTGSGITCTDDAGNARTNCSISGGVSSAYDTVQDEGVDLTQRSKINFIGGNVACVDNAGATKTDCTISGLTTINPTDNFLPYRQNATTFGDSPLVRLAAHQVELRNGASTGDFYVYSSWVDAANYARLWLGGDGASNTVMGQQSGTGAILPLDVGGRTIDFYTGSTTALSSVWRMESDGDLIPIATNDYDVGSNGSPVQNVYVGTGVRMKMGTSAVYSRGGGGVFYASATDVGNVGAGEDTLHTTNMDADSLGANEQLLRITAAGTFANNSDAKRFKVHFGSAVIFDTGSLSPTGAGDWEVNCTVVRTGAAAEKAFCKFFTTTSGITTNTMVDYSTQTVDLTSVVTIKTTGEGVSNNDIVAGFMRIEWHPSDP